MVGDADNEEAIGQNGKGVKEQLPHAHQLSENWEKGVSKARD